MTVQDYLTTDELIYSERMCLADREGPVMGSNDSDTALLGRVLAGKKNPPFPIRLTLEEEEDGEKKSDSGRDRAKRGGGKGAGVSDREWGQWTTAADAPASSFHSPLCQLSFLPLARTEFSTFFFFFFFHLSLLPISFLRCN